MTKQHLIFTDLDGTLLDHHTYSFAPALSTLNKLAKQDIPVIANTSKTFAELIEIRGAMGLTTPFIVENGAAIYIPISFLKEQPQDTVLKNGSWVKEFSSPISHWLEVLEQLKDQFSGEFSHFANMSIEDICDCTGLSEHDATLASTREYCEPVLWKGSQSSQTRFVEALQQLGASPLQGGRFLHVTGKCNKGTALTWLMSEYKKQFPDHLCQSIALGDGQNDIAMLEAADVAVRIKSPTSPLPALTRKNNVLTSDKFGPEGWAECIETLIFTTL